MIARDDPALAELDLHPHATLPDGLPVRLLAYAATDPAGVLVRCVDAAGALVGVPLLLDADDADALAVALIVARMRANALELVEQLAAAGHHYERPVVHLCPPPDRNPR
jgi:hypothetical protein